jgi:hypothetical protein
LGCYKHNDCHWNERGHRRVAETLTTAYESWRQAAVDARREPAAKAVPGGVLIETASARSS